MIVVVIGGGAAGMLAAWRAASRGADVLLLEKQARLGTKILISGGGKCNLTHAGPMESVRAAFRPNEAAFLKPAFYRFTNDDFLALLTDRGMAVVTRPDGRIFPVPPSDAKDVVALLERHVRDVGVRVRLGVAVDGLVEADGRVMGVRLLGGETIAADAVIVAVGGSSYPATGCTGDGWRWLEALGHTIVRLTAALAPLYLEPTPPSSWSGVALRDCVLRARRPGENGAPGKERMRWRGDLLFTHKGVSGPTALGVSREIAEALPEGSLVEVDVLPDEPLERVAARLTAFARENPRKGIGAFVAGLVPDRLERALLDAAGVDPATKGAYLGAKERNRLAATLKGWPLGSVRAVPLERGEVVAGGVALDEVDPRTMASKRRAGLYLCGEVLDIAGPVGGYNLQAAWSTGVVAGDSVTAS
jgi:predicted Rossmann fold flavoprotein